MDVVVDVEVVAAVVAVVVEVDVVAVKRRIVKLKTDIFIYFLFIQRDETYDII